MTKYCLCNKKVLLVIDDADQLNQLEVLAGKKDWFGLGSRIIITTRKECLLIEHLIEKRYQLLGLQDSEDFHPPRRYEHEGDFNLQLHKKLPDSIEHRKDDEPTKVQSKNDEQVGKVPNAVEDGVNMDSPPNFKVCVGCKRNIEHGAHKNWKGTHQWHPHCFRCHACDLPITVYKFSMHENHPYHTLCYRERQLRCGVCENLIPSNSDGQVKTMVHPISLQRSCPSHEDDGTPRCCGCARIKPRNTIYYLLNDGRHQCLECRDSAITEADQCEALFLEIQEVFDLKFQEKNILLHFVDKTEFLKVSKAAVGEKYGGHSKQLVIARFTTNIKRSILFSLKRPEVTAIKILSGLPRLTTGFLMAQTMMLAWLKVKCYRIRNMSPQVKIDMSQVLGHMWLEFVMNSVSDFEKKLGNFYQRRIESASGEGFRLGRKAVLKHGLRQTVDHIAMTGSFPLV
ncbi:protein DA1-related 1-like [Prunus persica]|uniref:protein DA1-related 1-like n=1 Tax=Prunus persica TaxID=3760 RepID=UPI0009AB2F0B|nr:protein DA1-related 1-like [Prunus persica]